MLKGLTRRILGRGSPAATAEGFFLSVRCTACGETFRLFVNKLTDLAQEFDQRGGLTYCLKKEIIGARCRNLIHVKMEFDANRNLVSRNIENGEFIEQ